MTITEDLNINIKCQKAKILIVDDNLNNIYTMKKILKSVNAELVTVTGGEEAIDILLNTNFALVLLDVQMPDINGYDVANFMGTINHAAETPIIFVTANACEYKAKQIGYQCGAVDYVTKPFDKDILKQKVNVFLNLYYRQQENILLYKEAQIANKTKSDFLANMSHEIRTPITGILGMADMLLKSELTSEQHDWTEIINTSGEHLLGIINDILDFSKIESGHLDLEQAEFNIYNAVSEVTDILSTFSQKKDFELLVDIAPNVPANVVGDIVRVKQILFNMLSNAIKFTEKGHVLLKMHCEQTNNDDDIRLFFIVEDTGIGVPEDKISNIFEKFSQAEESTTRRFGGTGLGLSICKRIIDRMDGHISLESDVGKGTTFYYDILLKKGSDIIKSREIPNTELNSIKVLIVDGYSINHEIIYQYLHEAGIDVDVVNTGIEGINKIQNSSIKNSPYDICIVNHDLSDISGLELSKRLSECSNIKKPYIILTVNSHYVKFDEDIKSCGISSLLIKPIYKDDLLDCMRLLLSDEHNRESLITLNYLNNLNESSSTVEKIIEKADAKRILIVDDNEVNMMYVQHLVEKYLDNIDTASNGKIAVEKAKANIYDIILMDCQMPVMDGFEATKIIKSNSDSPPKIIAFTANALVGDREKCLKAGMDDYITKPIKPLQLESVIKKWI